MIQGQLNLFEKPLGDILKENISIPGRTELLYTVPAKLAWLMDFFKQNESNPYISRPKNLFILKAREIDIIYSNIRKKYHITDEDILPKRPW